MSRKIDFPHLMVNGCALFAVAVSKEFPQLDGTKAYLMLDSPPPENKPA
jgi:hypothetical protein